MTLTAATARRAHFPFAVAFAVWSLAFPAGASAKSRLTLGSVVADGLDLRQLSCELDGGLLAGAAVVGALSKQKPALDACAPDGAAFPVAVSWSGGKATEIAVAAGPEAARECVKRALAKVALPTDGTCAMVVHTGRAPSKALATVEPARLRALLGKGQGSTEVRAFLKPLGRATVASYGEQVYHSFPPHGLSVLFQKGAVRTVFLYADGSDGFVAYAGALPESLDWTLSRRDVEAKLGSPTKSGGDGVIPFWAEYQSRLQVTYVGKSPTDLDNTMHHIVVISPP